VPDHEGPSEEAEEKVNGITDLIVAHDLEELKV